MISIDPLKTTGLSIVAEAADGHAEEFEVHDILGQAEVRIKDIGPELFVNDKPDAIARTGPWQLTLTVTARRYIYSSSLTPTDQRIMRLGDDMPAEQREPICAALARLREAWRGGDHYPDLDEALETIEDAAAELRQLLGGESGYWQQAEEE